MTQSKSAAYDYKILLMGDSGKVPVLALELFKPSIDS